jgi:hypothetical protein
MMFRDFIKYLSIFHSKKPPKSNDFKGLQIIMVYTGTTYEPFHAGFNEDIVTSL